MSSINVQTTLQSSNNILIVVIDKALQNERRDKIGSIVMPQQYMDYTNNLQFGTIKSFGKRTKEIFPNVEIGDVAIFEHTIEHKVETTNIRTDADAPKIIDKHLIKTNENGDEIRYLRVTKDRRSQLYGIVKGDVIIPSTNMIFCHKEAKITDYQKNENGIYTNSEKSKHLIQDAIQTAGETIRELEMTDAKMELNEMTYLIKERLGLMLKSAKEAQHKLIKRLNSIELIEMDVLFTNPLDNLEIQRGDTCLVDEKFIYPINLFGNQFLIIRDYDWVVAKKNKK